MKRSTRSNSLRKNGRSGQHSQNENVKSYQQAEKYRDYDGRDEIEESTSTFQTRPPSSASSRSVPMFVRRSCKPELLTNANDSDLENDVELILAKHNDGIYIFFVCLLKGEVTVTLKCIGVQTWYINHY